MVLRNKVGVHLANKEEMYNVDSLLSMGAQNYTVLHHNIQIAERVRQVYPDSLLLLRFYIPDWYSEDPRVWARRCAEHYHAGWQNLTRHVTPANEMNLEWEGGGSSAEWYRRINAWLLEWADEFKQHIPNAVLHWPAVAQGHQEDGRTVDGTMLPWAGYELCATSISAYDVVDVHPYWRREGFGLWDEQGRWWAWRFPEDRKMFFPNHPVFISEAGNFSVLHQTTPQEMVYFFHRLGEYPYVMGATPFIWHSGSEHRDNVWSRNPSIAQAVSEMHMPEFPMPIWDDPMPPPPPPPEARLEPVVEGWRTYWHLLPRAENPPTREDQQAVVFHHYGVDMVQKPGNSYEETMRRYLQAVARRHHERLGWPSIGYAYVIDKNGVIWWAAPSKWRNIHAGNQHYNDVGISVAFPADHRTTPLTQEQKNAALWLVQRLEATYDTDLEVTHHQAVRRGFTECPGTEVIEFVEGPLRAHV